MLFPRMDESPRLNASFSGASQIPGSFDLFTSPLIQVTDHTMQSCLVGGHLF